MADDHDRLPLVAGGAGDDGVIVGEPAVAVQLDEIGEEPIDVVEHVGPARVARHEHALPGRELAVDLRPGGAQLLIQALELPLARVGARQRRQRVHLLQQRRERFFELECLSRHRFCISTAEAQRTQR